MPIYSVSQIQQSQILAGLVNYYGGVARENYITIFEKIPGNNKKRQILTVTRKTIFAIKFLLKHFSHHRTLAWTNG